MTFFTHKFMALGVVKRFVFDRFVDFSRKRTAQILYYEYNEITGSGKFFCISGHLQKVLHRKLSPSEKSKC